MIRLSKPFDTAKTTVRLARRYSKARKTIPPPPKCGPKLAMFADDPTVPRIDITRRIEFNLKPQEQPNKPARSVKIPYFIQSAPEFRKELRRILIDNGIANSEHEEGDRKRILTMFPKKERERV